MNRYSDIVKKLKEIEEAWELGNENYDELNSRTPTSHGARDYTEYLLNTVRELMEELADLRAEMHHARAAVTEVANGLGYWASK